MWRFQNANSEHAFFTVFSHSKYKFTGAVSFSILHSVMSDHDGRSLHSEFSYMTCFYVIKFRLGFSTPPSGPSFDLNVLLLLQAKGSGHKFFLGAQQCECIENHV